MKTIQNLNNLKENLQVIDQYLTSRKDPEYSFALNLIKKGTCFVVAKQDESYKFYPSRFIGYTKNNMEAHLDNNQKHGGETNWVISGILGSKPMHDLELEKIYKEYCESLGFIANEKGSFGVERKYWDILTE